MIAPRGRVGGPWQPAARRCAAAIGSAILLAASVANGADADGEGGEDEVAPRRHIPVLSVRYHYAGATVLPAEQAGPEVDIDHHTVRFEGMAGHFFRDTGTIVAGSLRYNLAPVSFRIGTQAAERTSFHGLYGRLSLLQRFDASWGSLGFVRAGIASDFAGISWSDVGMSTGAALTYRVSERLQLSGGALYTNAFVNQLVLPLVRLQYRGESFRFLLMVPRGANAWYAPVDWFELGLQVASQAQRYGVHAEPRLGDRYARLDVSAGPAVRFYPFGDWFVGVEGGYDARYARLFQADAVRHALLDLAGGYAALSTGYMY